jgi:hypothetical protein
MALNRKQEERALDKDERELVAKSHHPALQDLGDKELTSLVKLLRERRDKASGEVQRRRREMRGKAAPKGAEPAASASGNKAKLGSRPARAHGLAGFAGRVVAKGAQAEEEGR